MADRLRRARIYAQKWPVYNRNSLPWNRLALHVQFAKRESFVRFPIDGNLLEAFRDGRVDLGRHVVVEPHCWIDVLGAGKLRIGDYTTINLGAFISAIDYLDIGSHCLFARGCFVADNNHRFDDPLRPVPWQGLTRKGPTRVGDNVWCGVNVAILSGVTVGERCVIGAGSVVTADLPSHTVCAGIPARPLREIDYNAELLPPVDLQGGWR
jgi:acetyltransferase-like isoleucine patch superfamily enzyme